jgi:hypothetical protein
LKKKEGDRDRPQACGYCGQGNSRIARTRESVSAMTMVLPAELGDARWMDLLGEAKRLGNRFQWINFLVFDLG